MERTDYDNRRHRNPRGGRGRPSRGAARSTERATHSGPSWVAPGAVSPQRNGCGEGAPAKKLVEAPNRWELPPQGPAALTTGEEEEKSLESPNDAHFAGVAGRLAAAKTLLEAIAPADFGPLMRALDSYAGLKAHLRDQRGMAFASNATLKMLELLPGLLGPDGEDVRAFFNAELPGAFLLATHHYARTTRPRAGLSWVASSYFPRADWPGAGAKSGPWADQALADEFALYREYRDCWLMGPAADPPHDGDLTDPAVVCALANAAHRRFPPTASTTSGATLYTSDAGIDASTDYNNQEALTALLNLGQVVCGLLSLARGGCFLTKMYTFFTPFSRSLIALVRSYFREAAVVKPLTSRPVNSEVYIVGRGFLGISAEAGTALLDRLAAERSRCAGLGAGAGGLAPLLSPACYSAVDSVLAAAASQIFDRQQVSFLEEARGLYDEYRGRLPELARRLQPSAAQASAEWLSRHEPLPLNPLQMLVPPAAGSDKRGGRLHSGRGQRGSRVKAPARAGPATGRGRLDCGTEFPKDFGPRDGRGPRSSAPETRGDEFPAEQDSGTRGIWPVLASGGERTFETGSLRDGSGSGSDRGPTSPRPPESGGELNDGSCGGEGDSSVASLGEPLSARDAGPGAGRGGEGLDPGSSTPASEIGPSRGRGRGRSGRGRSGRGGKGGEQRPRRG